jgi:two-component system, response regulator PdtaR
MEKLRVLVAEDETIIRLDLVSTLERAGLEVCAQARDAEEAVTMASVATPDVAILDVKMPCGGGIDAARRLLAERPLPIVMLTAFGEDRLVERAIEAGAYAYLTKPFRETDVLAAVRAAVARYAGHGGRLSVDVPSARGGSWPLAVERGPDGRVDVRLR